MFFLLRICVKYKTWNLWLEGVDVVFRVGVSVDWTVGRCIGTGVCRVVGGGVVSSDGGGVLLVGIDVDGEVEIDDYKGVE